MGKKSSQSSICKKHEKKQLNNLIKILRPKVYITDSSNFKNLVQQLTGNNNNYSSLSSPSPSILLQSPTIQETPDVQIEDHGYQENSHDVLFDSSCFSTTPLEGSPELQSVNSKMDFSSEYWDLESFLFDMDSVSCNFDPSYGILNQQQEVCVYDYDLSSFV